MPTMRPAPARTEPRIPRSGSELDGAEPEDFCRFVSELQQAGEDPLEDGGRSETPIRADDLAMRDRCQRAHFRVLPDT